MSLISKSIHNLINGVSQQPEALRLDSQAEASVNTFPSVVEGLKNRPSSWYMAKLMDGQMGNAHIHTIKRDKTEKYKVIITDGDLQVRDLAGVAKTITFPNGKGYLDVTDAGTDFTTMTIADYTFVVNKTQACAMLPDLSPSRGVEALVFIKQGSADAKYTITIDGIVQATYTLPTSSADTLTVATSLYNSLVTNLGATWTVVKERTSIWIKKNDLSDFEIKIEDSKSNTLSDVFKGSAQKFSELPTVAPAGFTVEIKGDTSANEDAFYVAFVCSNTTATFDKGTWKEVVKPGIKYKINQATMPHGLVRNSDGTFTFKELAWLDRRVGDEEVSPEPTFIGRTIRDMFFYQNRLGLLSDENVVMSEAGEFFNFFPTTVTTMVDSDPIDSPASSSKVSLLNFSCSFQEDLLFFSDLTQFALNKGDSDILSPKYAQVISVTDFENTTGCAPVNGGKNIYFGVNKGNYSGIREYYVDKTTVTRDSVDITSHIPKYIPGGLYKLISSTNESIILALTSQERNAIYVYKYFWAGNDKMQSAWVKWEFGGEVLNADFIETDLYLVVQYADGVYLLRQSIQPGYCDPEAPFEFYLDRKVKGEDCSTTYNPLTHLTTWTLPYQTVGGLKVAVRYPADPAFGLVPGQLVTLTSAVGNTVTAKGDYHALKVVLGEQFTMRHRFSKQTMKESSGANQGETPIGDGRLQLRYWTIQYSETGYFRVEVTPSYRTTYVYDFVSYNIGDPGTLLGEVPLTFGILKFPVMADSQEVTIEVINDSHLPCRLISAEWEGDFNIRNRRV